MLITDAMVLDHNGQFDLISRGKNTINIREYPAMGELKTSKGNLTKLSKSGDLMASYQLELNAVN